MALWRGQFWKSWLNEDLTLHRSLDLFLLFDKGKRARQHLLHATHTFCLCTLAIYKVSPDTLASVKELEEGISWYGMHGVINKK